MGKIHICMFARVLPAHQIGGMQDHTIDLARGIVRQGHRVTIFTTAHPHGVEYEEIDGIRIFYVKNTPPGIYSKEWWYKESIKKFEERVQCDQFHILHSQIFALSVRLQNIARKKYNIPAVMSFHGTTWDEFVTKLRTDFKITHPRQTLSLLRTFLYWIKKYCIVEIPLAHGSEFVIATSYRQRKIIHYNYFLPYRKIPLVLNGINTDLFRPNSNIPFNYGKYGIEQSEKIVLAIARLVQDKGIQYIIQALSLVLKHVANARLVIVGDGEYREPLDQLVRTLHLENNVTFTGFIELKELPAFLNVCSVFVNSTIRENGYDLTILEAMACEKPVIASDLGSIPDVIVHKQNGILLPPGDIYTLSKAVIELLRKSELSSRLGKAGRATIVEKFSLESMVKGTIEVYQRAIERTKE